MVTKTKKLISKACFNTIGICIGGPFDVLKPKYFITKFIVGIGAVVVTAPITIPCFIVARKMSQD